MRASFFLYFLLRGRIYGTIAKYKFVVIMSADE